MSEESVSNLINSASEIVKDKAVSLYEFLKKMSALGNMHWYFLKIRIWT